MKKLFWLLPLAILIACGPSTTELVPPETNTDANTAVSPTNSTNSTNDTDDTNEETGEATPPAAAANLDTFQPVSSIPEAAVVRQQDWREGATDPLIVIIEYGDFQ